MKPESSPNASRYGIPSLVVLGMNMLGVLFLVFVGLFTVPRFKMIFMDLMGSADTFHPLTRLFIMQPPSVYIGCAVVFVVVLVLKEFLLERKGLAFILNFAALLVQLVLTTLIVLSCFLPMRSLIQKMSDSPASPPRIQTNTP